MGRLIDLFEYYGIDNEPIINIVKSDNLGLVYMGSKRTIAKRIVEVIHKMHPSAIEFCSQGYNENDFVRFGLYEWLSREDLKVKSNIEVSAVEAIKLLVYSFGCKFQTYAYGEAKEKLYLCTPQ